MKIIISGEYSIIKNAPHEYYVNRLLAETVAVPSEWVLTESEIKVVRNECATVFDNIYLYVTVKATKPYKTAVIKPIQFGQENKQ